MLIGEISLHGKIFVPYERNLFNILTVPYREQDKIVWRVEMLSHQLEAIKKGWGRGQSNN